MKVFLIFLLTFLPVLIFADNEVTPKKVLVYSTVIDQIHLEFISKVAVTLQDEGYKVTLLLPVIDTNVRINNPLTNRLQNVIVIKPDQRCLEKMSELRKRKPVWSTTYGIAEMFDVILDSGKCAEGVCRNVFNNTELIDRLKHANFDIGLAEPNLICPFALFEFLGINKTMSIDSTAGLEGPKLAHGLPTTSAFISPVYSSMGNFEMEFLSRARNWVESSMNYFMASWTHRAELNVAREIFPNVSTWRELFQKLSYIFVNSDPLIDFAGLSSPKFVQIGGWSISNEKLKLSEDVESKYWNQTILISFGSYATNMLPEMKESLIEVFTTMSETKFLFEYENGVDDNITRSNLENLILIGSESQALVSDARINILMSHSPLDIANQVAFSGKPAIFIPLFGDQLRNAKMLEKHETAIVMTKKDLMNSNKILKTFKEILENSEYRQRARDLSEKLRNQPENPKQKFLSYFNFVARLGKSDNLDTEATQLWTFQLYQLDVYVALLVTVGSTLIVIVIVVKMLCKQYATRKVKTM